MKGYIVDGKAYIFPQTAAEIPEVEVDVFYVQEENFTEWVAENESIADKLVKYNYNVMTVKPKVWAGHTDDDLEPAPEPKTDPELEWSEDSATVTIGADDNVFPTLTNPHSVTVSYTSSDTEKATIDASTGEITLVAAGETTISAVFAGDDTYEAQTVTYTLTVEAAEPETRPIIVDDHLNAIQQIFDNNAGQNIDTEAVPVGDQLQVNLNSGFTFNKEATEGTIVTATLNGTDISDSHGANEFHYVTFEMPDEDSDLIVEEYTPNQ